LKKFVFPSRYFIQFCFGTFPHSDCFFWIFLCHCGKWRNFRWAVSYFFSLGRASFFPLSLIKKNCRRINNIMLRKHFKNKFNTVQNKGELDWRSLFCYCWRVFCNVCCTFTLWEKSAVEILFCGSLVNAFLSCYLVFSIAKRSRFKRNFGHYLARCLAGASTKFGWVYFKCTCSTHYRSRCNFSYNCDCAIHQSDFGGMVT